MNEIEIFLKSLDEINLDDDYAYERIILMLESKNIVLPTLTYRIPNNTIVFRSRENENIDTFNLVKDLACPSKEYVKKFNRVNRPFQSMFYCSDNRSSSYSEFMEYWLEKPTGTVFNITIGRWRIQEELNLILVYNREKLGNDFHSIKGNMCDNSNLLINDFLFNKFTKSAYKNKSLYILTSAIANTMLLRSECDGIIYPCVPRNGNGFNIALKSDVYKKGKLKLEMAFRETFITVKKDSAEKANHSSVLLIEGKLRNDGQTIDW